VPARIYVEARQMKAERTRSSAVSIIHRAPIRLDLAEEETAAS
jgi:hypothetical protein